MAMSSLNRLPPELLHTILKQLSISSLLSFAQTNRSNYVLATHALSQLELAIFPKQIHTTLAFLEEDCREEYDPDNEEDDEIETDRDPLSTVFLASLQCILKKKTPSQRYSRIDSIRYKVSRTTQSPAERSISPRPYVSPHHQGRKQRSPSPSSHVTSRKPSDLRELELVQQNNLASRVLSTPTLRNLKQVTLHLYAFHTESLATALSNLSHLQHLTLNFAHPYINDTILPANYWRQTPSCGSGSPHWNILTGVGQDTSSELKLRSLRSLTIRRAGITAFQLKCWISANPKLTELVLEKVRGVDLDFMTWLSYYINNTQCSSQGRLNTIMCGDNNENNDNNDNNNNNRTKSMLERIILKDCGNLSCQSSSDLTWLKTLLTSADDPDEIAQPTSILKCLSLKGSKSIDEDTFLHYIGVTQPSSPPPSPSSSSSDHFQPTDMTDLNDAYPWLSKINKLVTPKGLILRRGKIRSDRKFERSSSPALTVVGDEHSGSGSTTDKSWRYGPIDLDGNDDNLNSSQNPCGVIEIDPELL